VSEISSAANVESALERIAALPQLVLLLAASCLSVLGAVLIAPVLPQMAQDFAGMPGLAVLVPVVLTVPALVIGLTAPFAGFIADKIDRKRVLLIAMVAYSVVGTAPLYLDSLQTIIGSRVLLGICEAAIMTCCTTLIGDYWAGAQRARYLGLQTLVAAISATVFLAVGGVLGTSGWRTPSVNRLHFEQRGRGTGLWTGTLFVGQFLSPIILAAIGAGVGGLQPALGVLGVLAAVMAAVTLIAVRRNNEPLNVTHS
jgi:MFS family permease